MTMLKDTSIDIYEKKIFHLRKVIYSNYWQIYKLVYTEREISQLCLVHVNLVCFPSFPAPQRECI